MVAEARQHELFYREDTPTTRRLLPFL